MAYNNVYRGLEGEIIKDTGKAILFRVVDPKTSETIKQEWFPKSQLSSFGGKYDEVDGTFNYILASEWILGQKSLLSLSVPRDLIRIEGKPKELAAPYTGTTNPDLNTLASISTEYLKANRPYTGTTKQDKADRAPYQDREQDSDNPDDYFAPYGFPEDE
jgi:hypothetical protein